MFQALIRDLSGALEIYGPYWYVQTIQSAQDKVTIDHESANQGDDFLSSSLSNLFLTLKLKLKIILFWIIFT